MAKGYWIARCVVTDEVAWSRYREANGPVFARFGGRFLVRGGPWVAREGEGRPRNIVLEFPSYAQALACFDSPDYAAARALRDGAGLIDLVIVEGYDGPQPS